ncbi:hypothetical protein HS088_TW02G00283 [Tripterygium wilfordii]|uniref:Uncharacterized protein n=1 Tax=Tripterygium wilfordii TaxID=458696 RepID=A0A7J7DYC5_TRIWF|nr:hypothetical protein HS088_TW02G00283 [Tripterygium wilfordii]
MELISRSIKLTIALNYRVYVGNGSIGKKSSQGTAKSTVLNTPPPYKLTKIIKLEKCYFGGTVAASFGSCLDPDMAALAAAVMAAAAAPNFAPPAAFIAPAILAKAAIPPTSIALKATVGFTSISYCT